MNIKQQILRKLRERFLYRSTPYLIESISEALDRFRQALGDEIKTMELDPIDTWEQGYNQAIIDVVEFILDGVDEADRKKEKTA